MGCRFPEMRFDQLRPDRAAEEWPAIDDNGRNAGDAEQGGTLDLVADLGQALVRAEHRSDARRIEPGRHPDLKQDAPVADVARLDWIEGQSVARILFEATGRYHHALEQALGRAGLATCKVNPRQARRFAEATGKLAKTDEADAAMLARMGLALEPQARPAPTENLNELRELHVARQALIKDQTAAKNRQKNSPWPCSSVRPKIGWETSSAS